MATDGAGNLYIADRHNHRIRKVDPSGIITTIAGSGERGDGGDGGPATQARMDHPWDVAVDVAGNVYIADWGNDRIRILRPPPKPPITEAVSKAAFTPSASHASMASPSGKRSAPETAAESEKPPSITWGGVRINIVVGPPREPEAPEAREDDRHDARSRQRRRSEAVPRVP